MRNTENLLPRSQIAHFASDACGGFSADIGVNFIEDEQADFILIGQRAFEGEHDPGDFTA